MTTAYVLLTALPPTKGHIKLIEFAECVADEVQVVLSSQPAEPMCEERFYALDWHFDSHRNVTINSFHMQIPQDPDTPGFREMWRVIMEMFGCGPDSIIVSSEPYGQWLAEVTGASFIPYDPGRELTPVKATHVRNDPWNNFHLIAEKFQPFLRLDVTIFGAESTGKTTLAKDLAKALNGHFFFEWARPYLEMVGPEITVASMTDIWKGQLALEVHGVEFFDKPVAFFDTDLYSTIGYWQLPHWADTLGPVPDGLIDDADLSDLYIITQSNIPFEQDPLRYGGDKREASDQYWIDVAEQYGLNYVVLESDGRYDRVAEAIEVIRPFKQRMRDRLAYDRGGF